MKPVHVLGRIDRVDNQILVQMLRQRQLHQNAMHRRIIVQRLHQRQQISLGNIHVALILEAVHPNLDRLLTLRTDVDLAGRILAHQHHGQTRRDAVVRFQPGNMGGNLFADGCGKCFPVEEFCGHEIGPLIVLLVA